MLETKEFTTRLNHQRTSLARAHRLRIRIHYVYRQRIELRIFRQSFKRRTDRMSMIVDGFDLRDPEAS